MIFDPWSKLDHICKNCGHVLGLHQFRDDACPTIISLNCESNTYSDTSKFEEKTDETQPTA